MTIIDYAEQRKKFLLNNFKLFELYPTELIDIAYQLAEEDFMNEAYASRTQEQSEKLADAITMISKLESQVYEQNKTIMYLTAELARMQDTSSE